MPSCSATFGVTSTIRLGAIGPRSSTRTSADLPVLRLVTFAVVPNGKVLLAAALELGLNRVPSASCRWMCRP